MKKDAPLTFQNANHETLLLRRASRPILSFVCFVGLLSLLFLSNAIPSPFALWKCGHSRSIPKKYAVCSEPGKRSIHLVDETNSLAECFAVEDGVISFVGDSESIRLGRYGPILYTPKNSIVVPGISDSHAHLLAYGSSKLIPLESGKTIPDTVKKVREYILANPELANNKSKTIEGWGWNHMAWPAKGLPTAADLDADPVIRGRPVILESKDGHAFWVSGTTLKANTPYPATYEGGSIVRDTFGDPTGVFLDNAQALIDRPVWSYDDMMKRFKLTVKDALSFGLTSVHDAMLFPLQIEFFKSLAESKNLPIRVRGFRYFDPEDSTYWGNISAPILDVGNGMYSVRSVKFVGDGAMRSGGAAMKEPYTDKPNEMGAMRVSGKTLNRVIPWYLRDGWQVNVHAIGDRANQLALDAFEGSLKGYNTSDIRPRLEHAQLMAPEDIKRLGELGIIASIQPSHAISDMWFAQSRIGPERVKGLYAFRSIIDAGARITLGSDFPVETPNPLVAFYAAITRLSVDGDSPHGKGGWFPAQRMTRSEVLRGMTIDPAYASFTESSLGSLEVGKKADFVILSEDIMTIPPQSILKTKVLATVLDGVPVYGKLQ